MKHEARFLEIDVIGEVTGERYVGEFKILPYMTSRQKAEHARLLTKETKGLVRDLGPNLEIFRQVLEPHLAPEQIDIATRAAIQTFNLSDPIVNEIDIIAELAVLIQEGPEWWKPFDLVDTSPYAELKKQLLQAQMPKKPDETTEIAP